MLVILLIAGAVLNTSKAKLAITVENSNKDHVTAITPGSDVILNCSSTVGDNISEIEWRKNENLITGEIQATLELHKVTTKNTNGKYTCIDKQSNESTTYSLRVDEPPTVKVNLRHISFSNPTDKPKILTCRSKGWPKPVVYWKTPMGTTIANSSVLVTPGSMINLQEKFVCYAKNRAGTAKETCYITKNPYELPCFSSPKITSERNRTVFGYSGGIASFAVTTLCTPKTATSSKWLFTGQALKRGSKYSISDTYLKEHKAVFEMVVKNLSSSDSGLYKLIVQTSKETSKLEEYIKLEVRERVSVTNPANNTEQSSSQEKSEYTKIWIPLVVSSCVVFAFAIVLANFLVKRKKYALYKGKKFALFKGLKKETPTFDAFISYSSSDFDWVSQHLIPHLDEHHIKYSIHSKDFEIGKTIVDNMADSVYMCKHVIAVLSKRYLESSFCQTELDMAIWRSSINKKPVLTIINLDCDLTKKSPKIPKKNVYFQRIQRDDDGWKDELIHHLQLYISDPV